MRDRGHPSNEFWSWAVGVTFIVVLFFFLSDFDTGVVDRTTGTVVTPYFGAKTLVTQFCKSAAVRLPDGRVVIATMQTAPKHPCKRGDIVQVEAHRTMLTKRIEYVVR